MFPKLKDAYVSLETIYNALYALSVSELRKELIHCLRHGKATRRPRLGGVGRRNQVPDIVSIHVRPPETEDRPVLGYWEGDLIKEKDNASAVGTLVERASLNRMSLPIRKSMTYDQNREMTCHAEITQKTGVAIYCCDPYSPCQRGSNKNINGLIRQYLPKGTDLSLHSQEELDERALSLNRRPCKRFGFKCSIEVLTEVMQKEKALRVIMAKRRFINGVALSFRIRLSSVCFV